MKQRYEREAKTSLLMWVTLNDIALDQLGQGLVVVFSDSLQTGLKPSQTNPTLFLCYAQSED